MRFHRERSCPPARDASLADANGDQLPDLLLAWVIIAKTVSGGRSDAGFGTLPINSRGNGNWQTSVLQGVRG